jgi:probable phosphoglycerate mutase
MPKFPDLFILRHGQTEWNLLKKYQGQMDSPLTKLGQAQAALQGEILQKHLAGRSLPAYASPLRRAAHTAELALLPLEQQARHDSRLKEVGFGEWEGKTYVEVFGADDIDRAKNRFERYFSSPGGESYQDIASRCRAFLDDLEGESIVITHGITSRILRGIWLRLTPEAMLDLPIGQGCVYHLHSGTEHCLEASLASTAPPAK